MTRVEQKPTFTGTISSIETEGDILTFKIKVPEEQRMEQAYLFDNNGEFVGSRPKGDRFLEGLAIGEKVNICDDNLGNDSLSRLGARWRLERVETGGSPESPTTV